METINQISYLSFNNNHVEEVTRLISFSESNELKVYTDAKKLIEEIHLPYIILLDAYDKLMVGYIRRIRSLSLVPIVCLADDVDDSSIVLFLNSGADLILEYTISPDVLKAHIQAMLKRVAKKKFIAPTENIFFSNSTIDVDERSLIIGSEPPIHLVVKEFQLLLLFIKNINKTLERVDILEQIWGESDYFKGRSLDVYICKLKKKVEKIKDVRLLNKWGKGFQLEYKP